VEQGDLHKRWKLVSKRLRNFHQCVVLPVGSLSSGLCRHRAILFKVKNMFLTSLVICISNVCVKRRRCVSVADLLLVFVISD